MNTKYKTNINHNSLQGFMNGITQAALVVKKTMGAAGTNAVIEIEQYPFHLVTNDGATLIENMWFEDPLENMGLQFLKEVVGRSNKNSGDGSSTTTCLVEAILLEGMKEQSNGMEIKKSLDACIPLIEESINRQKKMITSDDFERLKQVATISSEDEALGSLLAEIYGKIGTTGIIQPEYVLGKQGNSYDFIQGVRYANGTGYLSPAMVHDEEAIKENRKETRAVYENPLILVTKRKISSINDIDKLLKGVGSKKDIVIFTDDMDSQVASMMIATHQARKSGYDLSKPRITIIKAPVLWKNYVFEDFAKCVGATILEDSTGVNFKNVEDKHLGTCGKIIIDKDETVIIGTQDLTDHITQLQSIVDSQNDSDDDALRRIGWLTAKTVLLKVGGLSETELTYRRLKTEDAINATRSALTEGIVAGGGICFAKIAADFGANQETIGKKILFKVLYTPMKQIIENYGKNISELNSLEWKENDGFNSKTGEIVDMFESGIIDSAKISLNAVKNAIGIASTILTADSCLILPPQKPQPMMMPQFPPMQ